MTETSFPFAFWAATNWGMIQLAMWSAAAAFLPPAMAFWLIVSSTVSPPPPPLSPPPEPQAASPSASAATTATPIGLLRNTMQPSDTSYDLGTTGNIADIRMS